MFGKQTWSKIGQDTKNTWNKVKAKDTWVGEKGAFGKETWAGQTGLFGKNNAEKVKGLVKKVKTKLSKKQDGGKVDNELDEKDRAEREEKERVALSMLKEGQITQEEYEQILEQATSEPTPQEEVVDEAAAMEAMTPSAETIPIAEEDGRDLVDTADL